MASFKSFFISVQLKLKPLDARLRLERPNVEPHRQQLGYWARSEEDEDGRVFQLARRSEP